MNAKMSDEENSNFKLFIGYMMCASTATLIDIGLLYCFTEFLQIWYFYSAAISFISGIVINFSMNKHYNFKNRSKRIAPQFGIFASVALIGLALNQIILYTLVEFADLWYILAKIISILIVVIWSFYGHKRFTFGLLK